jgi:tetratricopeptide (TPR) repeat protein
VTERPARLERKHRIALGVIVAFAFALRLWMVLGQRDDILFDHPVLDEERFVTTARAMAAGHAVEQRPYWQPPGMLYALSTTFRVAGPGLVVPRLIQVLLSTAACLLVFAVGRRLFGNRVGLIAAAVLAGHGVLVFESYELLGATWMLFFDLLALLLLLIAGERRTGPPTFAAGLAFGISALFAPTILPFALCAAVWLWFRRPLLVVALAAGVLLPIAPVTVRNYQHGGELVLVSTNGGINFYIGNNADYHATLAVRPGRHWNEMEAEPARLGIPPGAASGWFWRKGLAFWRDRPLDAVLLAARKEYLFVHAAELPRDTDIYAARSSSTALAILVWPAPIRFPGVVLFPLALIGLYACWRDRRRLAMLYAFLAVQAVMVPAFFVSARHRVPALIGFALFAAAAVVFVVDHWRDTRGPRRALPIGVAVVLAVLVSLPVREASVSYVAEPELYRGLAFRDRGDLDAAIAAFRRAEAIDPGDERIAWELGDTLAALGRKREAVDAWRRAAALDPWDSRPARLASAILVELGDADGAVALLEAHVAAARREPAHYASDHLNLFYLHARSGRRPRAIAALHAAVAADPAYVRERIGGLVRALSQGPPIDDAAFWSEVEAVGRRLGP